MKGDMEILNDGHDEKIVNIFAQATKVLEEATALAAAIKALVENVPTVDEEPNLHTGMYL